MGLACLQFLRHRQRKSGRCTENCAWCAQSRHFKADVAQYPLIDEAKALEAARKAAAAGCSRFSLVTSGRKLSAREVRETAALVRAIRRETNLEVCLSSGLLKQSELEELRRAGASRFHCNLEAAAPVFKKLCTTRAISDKIATLAAARRAGMDVCSGGIIGMGETESDRIDLALTLRRLEIPSIPINVLVPIAGTPLETTSLISDEEILRTVAIFRLINPSAWLRFAGGRARLSESLQLAAMQAGINSAIAGDMLTTAGTAVDNDRRLVAQAAYGFEEDDVRAVDAAHIWHPYAGTVTPPPVEVVAAARGTRITLADGRELIDGISSWWCAAFGHNPPEVVNAIRRQSETLSHVMFAGFTHKPAAELAKKLIALAPKGLQKVFFVDSGSVAVEAAMKMALHYQVALGQGTRTNFFALEAGYHGDTANAMSVSDPEAAMHRIYQSALPKRIFIASPLSRFGGEWQDVDRERLEKAFAEHGHEAAGFILEPIVQAANAMRFYHPEYLRHVRRLCTEYGVVLIADEIATGFGRTGRTFASDWAGITPDIMTVGKALTAGVLPLAAVLATNPLADASPRLPAWALCTGLPSWPIPWRVLQRAPHLTFTQAATGRPRCGESKPRSRPSLKSFARGPPYATCVCAAPSALLSLTVQCRQRPCSTSSSRAASGFAPSATFCTSCRPTSRPTPKSTRLQRPCARCSTSPSKALDLRRNGVPFFQLLLTKGAPQGVVDIIAYLCTFRRSPSRITIPSALHLPR